MINTVQKLLLIRPMGILPIPTINIDKRLEVTKLTVIPLIIITVMAQKPVLIKQMETQLLLIINTVKKLAVIRLMAIQPQFMTNMVEKLVHTKRIPLAEPPNTTAMTEKLEVISKFIIKY